MTITGCRACGNRDMIKVLDLGDQHLSDFREDDSRPPRAPLTLLYCPGCTLLQLRDAASPELLYHENYSFKSGVSGGIALNLGEVVQHVIDFFAETPPLRVVRSWLDIGSNDGTLLDFVPSSINRVGIDPLGQFADEARTHADRIVVDFFDPGYFEEGEFDVITAVSMFYDLDDPHRFIDGVEKVLAPGGIFVVQQNYVGDMVASTSVDNVSHEHLAYYSLASLRYVLRRHGLEVVDVARSPINGGCFRTIIVRSDDYPVLLRRQSENVGRFAQAEEGKGLDYLATYRTFARRAQHALEDVRRFVRGINADGGRIYVYGASTRGAVLWQGAGLDVVDLPKVVDRNPAKVGRYMSAIGAPIIPEEEMHADPPDYLLVGPWWFRDYFIEHEADYLRRGGRMVFPLPHLEVIGG